MPDTVDALPLTPRIITVVGVVVKAAGYRSAMTCMYAIKTWHVVRGHRWDEQLELDLPQQAY